MSKLTIQGQAARDVILRGVDFLADVVKITEGPRGRNVLLGQRALGQTPKCTRDGVTVSNYVNPVDPAEQIGADLIREAAQKTDNAVGDGTTASIVIAQAMIHQGFERIALGANPMAMERGIHKATDFVIDKLRAMAVEVEGQKVFQVATVSAHGDEEIGKLVADAVERAGRDGIVTAEPSITSATYLETVAGLELEKSNLISSYFITHPEEVKCELNECRILLWEGTLATAKSLVPILQQLNEAQGTALIIVAGGFEQEALSVLIKNKVKLGLPMNVVRMEAYGDRRKEVMRDIAALCGGTAYTEDMGVKIENVLLKDLGVARKVVTTMSKTQIIDGRGKTDILKGRIESIRNEIENAALEQKTILRKRLAALLGGITVIKVGGITVTAMEETKDRVVDAMSAAKAAVEQGIVAGGGTALYRASEGLVRFTVSDEELPGVAAVRWACCAVVKQIAANAGLDPNEICQRLTAHSTFGYNAFSGVFEDLVETGIIDPVKVVCEALRNASSVACSILTMGAIVSEIPVEKQNV